MRLPLFILIIITAALLCSCGKGTPGEPENAEIDFSIPVDKTGLPVPFPHDTLDKLEDEFNNGKAVLTEDTAKQFVQVISRARKQREDLGRTPSSEEFEKLAKELGFPSSLEMVQFISKHSKPFYILTDLARYEHNLNKPEPQGDTEMQFKQLKTNIRQSPVSKNDIPIVQNHWPQWVQGLDLLKQ